MLTFVLKNLLWLKMVPILTLLRAEENSPLHQVRYFISATGDAIRKKWF